MENKKVSDPWADNNVRFKELLNSKPKPGDILRTKDGSALKLFTSESGGRVSMYVCCAVDPEATGWYLYDITVGLRALILPTTQAQLIRKYKNIEDIKVSALRVIRLSVKGTSLICDVVE